MDLKTIEDKAADSTTWHDEYQGFIAGALWMQSENEKINAELLEALEKLVIALPTGNYQSLYVEKAKSVIAKNKSL